MQVGESCFRHGKVYQFIGCEAQCQLNCRICYDCLRSVDNEHRKGVSNHQTISLEQLEMHFGRLQKHSLEGVGQCEQALEKYFGLFETLLRQQIERQRGRLRKFIRRILLTGITSDERKMDVILALFNRDFTDLTCHQVEGVSELLFNFVPRNNPAGFQQFKDYLTSKEGGIVAEVKEIVNSRSWHKTFLKDIDEEFECPVLSEQPDPPSPPRSPSPKEPVVKKKEESPRPKQMKKEVKRIQVSSNGLLELSGSTLVQGRDERAFLAKMFDHRRIKSAQLLYRASEHDFSAKAFHQLCDQKPNTLVLIKTEFNKIIGGFSAVAWKSTPNTLHPDNKKESFIFSLSLKQKMHLIDEKSAILNSVNFGPTFGAGADIAICHQGHLERTSYSEFPYSYGNSRYKECNQHSTALFTGQKNGNHFLLKEWEVWKITFE